MLKVPFAKLHGAENDFLFTREKHLPVAPEHWPHLARAICERHTGVGADGWYVVTIAKTGENAAPSLRLYNADGSSAEVSGNGTRCAALYLVEEGLADPAGVQIATGAGLRTLRRLESRGGASAWKGESLWEMAMGIPSWKDEDIHRRIPLRKGPCEATLVHVGNPQCVLFVSDFPEDWRETGAQLESHPLFPDRTNVSFVRVIGRNRVEVRIFERGVGETRSSGTGATGAGIAAIVRGVAESPVEVITPAGPLRLRWDGDQAFLTGPAAPVARGEFLYRGTDSTEGSITR